MPTRKKKQQKRPYLAKENHEPLLISVGNAGLNSNAPLAAQIPVVRSSVSPNSIPDGPLDSADGQVGSLIHFYNIRFLNNYCVAEIQYQDRLVRKLKGRVLIDYVATSKRKNSHSQDERILRYSNFFSGENAD